MKRKEEWKQTEEKRRKRIVKEGKGMRMKKKKGTRWRYKEIKVEGKRRKEKEGEKEIGQKGKMKGRKNVYKTCPHL